MNSASRIRAYLVISPKRAAELPNRKYAAQPVFSGDQDQYK